MTQIPPEPLVPNNTLITKTPEEGRALAIMLARHSVHAMLEVLKSGRAQYAHDPFGLISASHVVAVAFATIAAADNYWRQGSPDNHASGGGFCCTGPSTHPVNWGEGSFTLVGPVIDRMRR